MACQTNPVTPDRDGTPVGWCDVGAPDDIRGGWRRRGVTSQVIEGAVAVSAQHGAPAVEAYPVDAEGGRRGTWTL